MTAWLKALLAGPVFEDEDKTRVAGLANAVLLMTLVLMIVFPVVTAFAVPSELGITSAACAMVAAIALGLLFLVRYGYVRTAGVLLATMFFLMVTWSVYSYRGIRDLTIAGYFLVLVLAALLVGGHAPTIYGVVCVLTTMGAFYAEVSGAITVSIEDQPSVFQLTTLVAALGLMALLLRLAVRRINEGLALARRSAQALTESYRQAEASRDELGARADTLARRTSYLEATAEVAHDATAALDLQELLSRVVQLVSERFRFYHTGVFLLDPSGQWAVLQAASSEGGQRMLDRGHRLRVGVEGIVGYVTGRGVPRIALDVGADAVFFDNPDLPETRSEMALPLRARGEVIGALDVQSVEPAAFSEEDVAVLQTLADQVAMAISNARLFQRAQEALEAERRAYGELSRRAWQELLRVRPHIGERYDPQGILPADGRWREEMRLAARKGQTVLGERSQSGTVATPIKVRGQVIGVLDAHKPEGGGGWTPEEVALLETLADQLGLTLESARLYEDAQRRATTERLVGEVTARLRETLAVDTVLQTAAREIGESLGLHDVTIRLAAGDGADSLQAESSASLPEGEPVDEAEG